MASYPCETCKFRAHYDKNPKSVVGRFWRWHINFCPGFKAYFTHQDEETKAVLREKYSFYEVQIVKASALVVVQFLPDKAGAQKLAHFFIAIALIAALAIGFMDRKKNKDEE